MDLQSGMRWLRRSIAFAVLAGSAMLVGGAPAVAGTAPWRLSYLPVPTGAGSSFVNGGDPTGKYVVGGALVYTAEGSSSVNILWTAGRLTVVQLPFADAVLFDVNSSGVAVGTRQDDGGRAHAFVYQDGAVRELPSPDPAWQTQAVAINSRGDILGSVIDPGSTWFERAVVWPAATPQTVRQLLAKDRVTPWDIDDDGTVAAQSGGWIMPGPAIVWRPDDTVEELPRRPAARR